jgi:hypothetical protein
MLSGQSARGGTVHRKITWYFFMGLPRPTKKRNYFWRDVFHVQRRKRVFGLRQ